GDCDVILNAKETEDKRQFLRSYKTFFSTNSKGTLKERKYILWASDFMIGRARKCANFFIDFTYTGIPVGFKQILIIAGRNIITNEFLPVCFGLVNCKQ